MIVVDTNVLSEALKPVPDMQVMLWLKADGQNYHVPAVVIAELHAGVNILPPGKRKQNLEIAIDHIVARMLLLDRLLSMDADVARAYGEVIGKRRKQGLMITAMDALVAATAITHKATLATRNIKDFEGLDVPLINPWVK
jgi:toxin FitB